MFFFFFFSSRRRHTRLQGDWSSDVCSSDLELGDGEDARRGAAAAPCVDSPALCMACRTEQTQMNHPRSGASYPESIISIGCGEICRASKPGASGFEMLSCPINSTHDGHQSFPSTLEPGLIGD